MKPLVSILIPAYNAERWIVETIESAIAQTWPRKEIIVVDDGSSDRTAELARRFASSSVQVVSHDNRGLCATENAAYRICQGDYIQCLDADDVLAPDKIERQLLALRESDSPMTLLSCPTGYFYHRTSHAFFPRTPLWQDLSPVEWLLRKMGQGLRMANSTWLVSRELADRAGPWIEQLDYDQDGEYFCRVLAASAGTRFVPEARVFIRKVPSLGRMSHIGISNKKKDGLLLSMKLHVQYLRSLEESERVRTACMAYLQTWYINFYPERPDLVAELQALARDLRGCLKPPRLGWKYSWMKPIFGWKTAKEVQTMLPFLKISCLSTWDNAMYQLASGRKTGALDAGGKAVVSVE